MSLINFLSLFLYIFPVFGSIDDINVGILQDTSPNFNHFSRLVTNSIHLAFNSTIYKHNFIIHIENVTSDVTCEEAVNNLYSSKVAVLFSIVNQKCLDVVYNRNMKEEAILLIAQTYTFDRCIENAYFGGLFLHKAYKRIF